MSKLKVGVIGTGNISGIYFKNGKRFESMEVVACADLDKERALAKAAEYGVRGCTVEELLADKEIQMVINLTVPQALRLPCRRLRRASTFIRRSLWPQRAKRASKCLSSPAAKVCASAVRRIRSSAGEFKRVSSWWRTGGSAGRSAQLRL